MADATLPPALQRRRAPLPVPPAPTHSNCLLVRIAPKDTAMFRFLLESYENIGYFTALEPKTALLKVIFSPQQERETRAALAEIGQSCKFCIEEWPFAQAAYNQTTGKRL